MTSFRTAVKFQIFICWLVPALLVKKFIISYKIFNSQVECVRVECEDNSDCPKAHVCVSNMCQDPCQVTNICGPHAECSAGPGPGQTMCTCMPGHTGDPDLGCVPIQYCLGDNQCPAGTSCSNGVCLCKYQPYIYQLNFGWYPSSFR